MLSFVKEIKSGDDYIYYHDDDGIEFARASVLENGTVDVRTNYHRGKRNYLSLEFARSAIDEDAWLLSN